jgi:hypothetical protein
VVEELLPASVAGLAEVNVDEWVVFGSGGLLDEGAHPIPMRQQTTRLTGQAGQTELNGFFHLLKHKKTQTDKILSR